MKLTSNSIRKIEQASKSNENQKLLDEIRENIEKNDQNLLATISGSYSQILDFCVTLNSINECIANLIELNNQSNSYLQDIRHKTRLNLDELKGINETEKNIDITLSALQKIERFENTIGVLQETTDIYEIVSKIKELEGYLLGFKKFTFYNKFNFVFLDNKAKVLKKLKSNVTAWIEDVKGSLNFLGCEFIRLMTTKQPILFDYRYVLRKNVNIHEIYDFLYFFTMLGDRREIIDKINLVRKNMIEELINDCNTLQDDVYNTIGFLLVDFYLITVDISFDLKEDYGAIVNNLLRTMKEKQSDAFELKNHLLTLRGALMALNYRKKALDDELFKLMFDFFQAEQKNIKTFSDIELFIDECKKIMKDYEIEDVKMLLLKSVDNVLMDHFCSDEDFLCILDRICEEFGHYKFRAQVKRDKETKSDFRKIRQYHLNVLDKALDEPKFENFNDIILKETDELLSLKIKDSERTALFHEMREYSFNKLKRREKLNGKDKVSHNAKRALLMKMFDQNLHL